jgi:TorA maturation chaperone TorD
MIFEENHNDSSQNNLLKGYNMLLYFSGSLIMYEPTEECVMDFFSDGLLKKLPISSSNPRFINAAALLRESCVSSDTCRTDLIRDHRRLFAFDGMRLAIPLESEYYGVQKNHDPAKSVREFYDSYGWKPRPGENAPDDHLGIEVLFLTKLIDKYLQLDDKPCCREMKKEIHRFIAQHVITWFGKWNEKVQENSLSSYYKGIGNLVLACAEDLYGIFDDQNSPL